MITVIIITNTVTIEMIVIKSFFDILIIAVRKVIL